MKNFNYFQPTELRYGLGRRKEIGEIIKRFGNRCLLVTVPVFPAFEKLFSEIKTNLKNSGIEVAHFDKVIPNPTIDVVTAGANMAQEHKADVILGLGGGSSMDTAKAIAVEATHEGTSWDYLFFRDIQPTDKTLPIVTITTTSGTGSQVTQVAVITNPQEKNKSALYHPILFPNVSIVDPELMISKPKKITASTGFDVFAHAFESYIHSNSSAYTDLMALEAIRIIAADLLKAVQDGSDIKVRARIAWADTLAGLCIANSGVTLPHGIGMAMSGIYPSIMHGEALAVIYPAIMNLSHTSAVNKFAQVGSIFDTSLVNETDDVAARESCNILNNFIESIGMQTSLEKLGISESEVEALAKASMVLPDYQNHPKVFSLDEIYELLKGCHKL